MDESQLIHEVQQADLATKKSIFKEALATADKHKNADELIHTVVEDASVEIKQAAVTAAVNNVDKTDATDILSEAVKQVPEDTRQEMAVDAVKAVSDEGKEGVAVEAVKAVSYEQKQNVAAEVVREVPDEAKKDIVTGVVMTASTKDKGEIIAETLKTLPSEARKGIVIEALKNLRSETRKRVLSDVISQTLSGKDLQELLASIQNQSEAKQTWLIRTLVLSTVFVLAALTALSFVVFRGEEITQELITIATAAIAALVGYIFGWTGSGRTGSRRGSS